MALIDDFAGRTMMFDGIRWFICIEFNSVVADSKNTNKIYVLNKSFS